MADFVITNSGDADGGLGDDSVTAIITLPGGVTMDLQAGGGASYGGTFFGPGANAITFNEMERFGFEDRTASADLVWTGVNADTILAGGGDDTLYTGGGADSVDGGAGRDLWGTHLEDLVQNTVIDLTAAESVFGAGGRLRGIEGFDQLWLGSGNDRVVIDDRQRLNDRLHSGAGDDRIETGIGGADSVNGGLGADLLSVRSRVAGGVTMDLQAGAVGSYGGTFFGPGGHAITFNDIERFLFDDRTASADLLWTGINANTILAGGGDDTLYTGGGADSVDGGAGRDIWGTHLEDLVQDTVIDLTAAESVFGAGGRLRGIEGFDQLWLGSGNDSVVIADGQRLNDRLHSGAGDDRIQMGIGGADSVNGGLGDDLLTLRSTVSGGVRLTELFAGFGSYAGVVDGPGSHGLQFSDIERFVFIDLARGDDVIWTGQHDDRLSGGGGGDELDAGAGRDRIDGGRGQDTLFGNDGADRLSGGAGRDSLSGGRGNDLMSGGADADRFVFGRSSGRDTITDFRADGQDIIDLTALDLQFADLTIRSSGEDAIIVLSRTDRITLVGVDADDLSAGMFGL